VVGRTVWPADASLSDRGKEKAVKRRLGLAALALGAVVAFTLTAASQPPDRQEKGPGRQGRPQRDGQPGGPGRFGPPRYEPGRLMPPFIRDELELTSEQQDKLDQLEKEVKDRLLKILTDDQKKKLRDLGRRGPRGPGGPPPGGPDGPPPGPPPDRD
jgi:hypothetical protein